MFIPHQSCQPTPSRSKVIAINMLYQLLALLHQNRPPSQQQLAFLKSPQTAQETIACQARCIGTVTNIPPGGVCDLRPHIHHQCHLATCHWHTAFCTKTGSPLICTGRRTAPIYHLDPIAANARGAGGSNRAGQRMETRQVRAPPGWAAPPGRDGRDGP